MSCNNSLFPSVNVRGFLGKLHLWPDTDVPIYMTDKRPEIQIGSHAAGQFLLLQIKQT